MNKIWLCVSAQINLLLLKSIFTAGQNELIMQNLPVVLVDVVLQWCRFFYFWGPWGSGG